VRITLAARAAVAPFAAASPMKAMVDRIIPLPLDPYKWDTPTPALFAVLERAFAAFADERVETFISAELRPTWFSFVLAAKLRPERAVTLRRVAYSRALVGSICDRLEIAVPRFERYADAHSGIHELERYRRLLRYLDAGEPVVPRWSVAPARARRFLREHELDPFSYVACFPSGSAGVSLKIWPPERFAAVLGAVRGTLGGRVLVAGDESERALLDDFARHCAAADLEPHVFAGGLSSFAELEALVANAWGFLGNDTGLAHLAAAFGVPGVTVYGGGTWPMYAPWGTGSVGVVHPLPCFRCFWDCAFGHGICVEEIPPEFVRSALEAAVAAPDAPARTVEVAQLGSETVAVMGAAARRYRAAQADRAARLEALLVLGRKNRRLFMLQDRRSEELTNEVALLRKEIDGLRVAIAERDDRIEAVERTAEERLRGIDEVQTAAGERQAAMLDVQAAADERLAAMLEIQAAADERATKLNRATAESETLRVALAERNRLIETLERTAKERLVGMNENQAVAEERLELIESLRATMAMKEAELAEREGRVAEVLRIAEERLRGMQELDTALTSVRAEAEKRATLIAEMSEVLDRQDREIARLRADTR
jgi:ADP-heptose:LPS heptosyltransferase